MRVSRDPQGTQWTQNISKLWQAKILDLPTLKERLPGAVLVVLDSAGCSFNTHSDGQARTNRLSELGFTALCTDIASSKLAYTSKEFYDDNDTRQLAIQLEERRHVENTTCQIHFIKPEQVEGLVRDFLSNLPGKCILVGYDLKQELRWMSSTLPSLADLFVAWVDVQELVYHRSISSSPTSRVHEQLGLATALQTMGLSAAPRARNTRAVNDCCRIFQVLAGLIQSVPFSLPGPRGPRIPSFSKYISLPRPDRERHPFALRISRSDGRRLPLRSTHEVAIIFKDHKGPRAVGLNWQSEHARREGTKFWWLSFRTQEDLNNFYRRIHGSDFLGFTVCARLDFPPDNLEEFSAMAGTMAVLKLGDTRREQNASSVIGLDPTQLRGMTLSFGADFHMQISWG